MTMRLIFAFKKLSIDWAQSRGEIRLFIDENMKQSFSECQWDGWCDASLSHLHVWDRRCIALNSTESEIIDINTSWPFYFMTNAHSAHTGSDGRGTMVSTAIRYGMNIKTEGFRRGNMLYRPFSLVTQCVALTRQTFRIPVSKWYSLCEISAI